MAAVKTTAMSRRFQFSLRALLLVTAVIAGPCAWLGYNVNLVRQRSAMMADFNDSGRNSGIRIPGTMPPHREVSIPWIRIVLGDYPVRDLFYLPESDPDGSKLQRVRSLFRETEIWGWPAAEDELPPAMKRWPPDRYFMF